MLDMRVLFIKLVKKLAGESKYIANIEKQGVAFYHHSITEDLCALFNVTPEDILYKNLFEIHPFNVANERYKLYEKAWCGEDVLYKVNSSLNADNAFYAVISPVFEKGKVIRLILHAIPYYMIPVQLRGIA